MSGMTTRWFLGIATWGAMGAAVSLSLVFSTNYALAQSKITPDNTLGAEKSNVIPNYNGLPVEVINGGAVRGQNLFHSFLEFNVSQGRGAYFSSPSAAIQNIVTRVTGSNRSEILGVLGTFGNSNPNLFLINPNGIIFGPNARLNVGGSFIATTANAIQFGQSGFFSATNPEAPSPLLTINPSALLFNQIATAPIQNSSTASAEVNPAGFNAFGLRVPDGKSLLLVGGNVRMDGGQLNAYGGRVELGGLAASGNVGLNVDGDKLSLNFPASSTRADISLTNGAAVYVEAAGGGDIAVNARNLEVSGGSVLSAGIGQRLGNAGAKAGDITLNATGDVKLDGSGIFNNVLSQATGKGGDINITTGTLSLTNGAQLDTSTFGRGDAGSVKIVTPGSVTLDNNSKVWSLAGGVGNSGGISIDTGSLTVANSSELNSSNASGIGRAGDITIKARDQVLFNGGFAFSRLEKGGRGRAGDISITTDGSVLVTGIPSNVANSGIGQLVSATFGEGDAGNVTISAGKNVSFDGRGSDIYTLEGLNGGMGNAGNIKIDSKSLSVLNGARLIASTENQENAGNINITTHDTIKVDGMSNGSPSQIFTAVPDYNSKGKGGQINLNTGELSVTNGAQLFSITNNQDASDININARDRISFDGTRSGLFSNVNSGGVGRGANINLTTDSLSVTNGAQVVSSTSGRGNAGSLNVSASDSVVLSGTSPDGLSSSLSTSSALGATGAAGSLTIKTPTLQVRDGAGVSTSTLGEGSTGNITIKANTTSLDGAKSAVSNTSGASLAPIIRITLEENRPVVTVEPRQQTVFQNARGNSGNINITTGSLSVTNGAQLNTSTFGKAAAGSIIVNTSNAKFSGTDTNGSSSGAFSAVQSGALGNGGAIDITTDKLTVDNGAQLVASTFGNGNAGDVRISGKEVSFNGVSGNNGSPSGAFSAVASGGLGKGGNINVTTGSVSVTNGAQLSANTNTGGGGDAGSININAGDTVSIDGVSGKGFPSSASSAVEAGASGKGGNLTIATKRLNIVNGAEGTVSNLGNGNAGDLKVRADFIDLNNQGKLTANSVTGFGGNAELTVKDILLMRRGSLISNTSGTTQAGGNEGNLKLTTKFLVAPSNENNDIITNAFSGQGGRINIVATEGIYGFVVRSRLDLERLRPTDLDPRQLPTNDIVAISQGNTNIFTPDIDPSRGLVKIPTVVVNTPKPIAKSCAAFADEGGSQFIITGRGGLPPSPDEPLTNDVVWTDARLPVTTVQPNANKPKAKPHSKPKAEPIAIVPATGWVFNKDKGEVTLISNVPNNSDLGSNPATCSSQK